MDFPQLINLFPNLAFGLIALWFVQQIQKDRMAENARYTANLERINDLYNALVEKTINAIANNASLSSRNGEMIDKLASDLYAIKTDSSIIRERVDRIIRDNTRRDTANRGGSSGASADD